MPLFEPAHQELPWYGTMTRNTLLGQARNAPDQFNLDQFYSQLYGGLSGLNYQNSLLGTEGGPQSFSWKSYDGKQRTANFDTPASRGSLDLYEHEIAPAMQRIQADAQRYGREADVQDVATLGPRLRDALRTASPEQSALLDKLYNNASSDLDLGAGLNASESRNIANASRAGAAARGMGLGPNDNFNEALASLNYGRGLQEQRRGNALQTLSGLESFYGDPYARILGRNDGSGAMTANFFGNTGGGRGMMGTGQFNPDDPLNYNINAFNANASNQAHNMGQMQWAHMMDQTKDTLQSTAKMMFGGGGV